MLLQHWGGQYRQRDKERWMDAMPLRYSCRHFKVDTDMSLISALEYSTARLALKGTRLVLCEVREDIPLLIPVPFISSFTGVTRYAAVIADVNRKDYKTLAGIIGEAFVLEATALGVATCWVSGNFRRSACNVPLYEGEQVLAVIPFGLAEDNTFARRRKALKALCQNDPATWPLWAYQAAEAVRSAPSAINRQPWRFDYAGFTLQVSFPSLNSLDTGIALLHLCCALNEAQYRYQINEKDRSILIFQGEPHDFV